MVLTYDAYSETVQEKEGKDKELESLKQEITVLQKNQIQHTESWESIRRDMAEMRKNLRIT
jgi:hypothetical protein